MNSFSHAPIAWAAHRHWFATKLNDPETLLLIGQNSAGPVGQVRFEIQGDLAQVSMATGEQLARGENIDVLRPGSRRHGLHPRLLPLLEGRRAARAISMGDGLTEEDINPPL